MKLSPTFVFTILSLSLNFAATAVAAESCELTEADRAANANLSFDDFDQRGTTPTTSRKLGERECYAEAARASEHYLLFGPLLDQHQRTVVTWHMGQYLALNGDEETAARILAATRRQPVNADDTLDWNTYVIGTWAFLTKDRNLLRTASQKLSSAPGVGNTMNARVLQGLEACFEKPYRDAYGTTACMPAKP